MKTATIKKSSVSKILCAAVLGVAASVSVAASAADYGETRVTTSAEGLRTTTVSIADLDLNSVDARDTLHRRLEMAALKVCGSPYRGTAGSLAQAVENKNCADSAVAEALRSISETEVAVATR